MPLQGEYILLPFTPTCRFALRRAVCRLPLRGVSCRSAILSWQYNGVICNYILGRYWHCFISPYPRAESPKALSSGRASASPRVNRVKWFFALQGQKRSGGLSVWRKVVIVSYLVTSIKFPQSNYLTFGGLLSRNAGDFFWVGQCRGRFLRVFERLASIWVSSVCKRSVDLRKVSVDVGKIRLHLFKKRRRLKLANPSSFVC